MERVNFFSGSPWEPMRGFARAVKVGDMLYISGTTAMATDGSVRGLDDPYEQTKVVLEKLKDVVIKAGFSFGDIVRTRLFVTQLSKWEEFARAHREAFEEIRPASSIVQVQRLFDPRLLIEMEADVCRGASRVVVVDLRSAES